MSGKLFSAGYPRNVIASYEQGYCRNIFATCIGKYDTREQTKKFVYLGFREINPIGYVRFEYVYMLSNPNIHFYARFGEIRDSNKNIVAHYEGDTDGALASYLVMYSQGLLPKVCEPSTKTKDSPNIPVSGNKSYESSSNSPNISIPVGGGDTSGGGGGFIVILLGILLLIYLAFVFPYGILANMLPNWIKNGEYGGPIFFVLFSFIALVVASIITIKKSEETKFWGIMTDFYGVAFAAVSIAGALGFIVALLETIFTPLEIGVDTVLGLILALPMYWLFTAVPSIPFAIVTLIIIKIKKL